MAPRMAAKGHVTIFFIISSNKQIQRIYVPRHVKMPEKWLSSTSGKSDKK